MFPSGPAAGLCAHSDAMYWLTSSPEFWRWRAILGEVWIGVRGQFETRTGRQVLARCTLVRSGFHVPGWHTLAVVMMVGRR
ncbi:uncharacterized protein CC84DRAFT_529660 [Paraphaeosphaeria sporulosa]|uniref:Uncharacterized protein n=1 Tax=Paraphaeosphaeria sporulosa TaxID=1460663 RepID=A0A177CKF8_9PLEO|nr:uncharacterized protein CC84DRAFT_529660 [Paraphaeosphaeria sporulosa]OAG07983.1 hypothetical protein CC84DRAFT_529660 [Paraphaeosphaeria sporulosa]